jgi:hypothetical protein
VLAQLQEDMNRYHGVSGVGGSNPLVPTKIPKENQPSRLVFLCLQQRTSFEYLYSKIQK